MQAEVFYAGEPVGTLSWTPDTYGVQVRLDCACPDSGDGLLRCYAGIGDRAMRIGLPEPQNGRLRLERRLTRETLRAAGYADTPPVQFYLAVQPEAGVPEQDSARQAGESDERTIQQPETRAANRRRSAGCTAQRRRGTGWAGRGCAHPAVRVCA